MKLQSLEDKPDKLWVKTVWAQNIVIDFIAELHHSKNKKQISLFFRSICLDMSMIIVLLVKLEYDNTMAMMSEQAAEEGICNLMILQQQ